jgi:MOSC domain-containing protein YiiM
MRILFGGSMKIRHIYISPEHIFVGHHGKPSGDTPMEEVAEVECVASKGLKGDRYFAFKKDYKGQVTFFSEEVYEGLCEQMQVMDKDPSVFRRNIIVRGVDLNSLIGTEFEVQGVRFIGTQEAAPCYWMNQAFGEGAEQKLKGNGGLRARILSDGILRRDG